MLWIGLAALTGVTLVCILWPLRSARSAVPRASGEAAFLRGQLDGVAREVEQGYIPDGAGEAARAEIGRRLIAVARRDETVLVTADFATARRGRRTVAAGFVALCLPVLAFGLYSRIGDPGHAAAVAKVVDTAQPAAAAGDMTVIVAQVEAHLAKNPEDGRGYEVLAPVYMRMGRSDDAAQAWAAAIRLLGATAEREASYGEALFAAAGSIVTADSRAAFEAAVARDEKSAKGRFYLGLAAEQEGDKAKARTLWSALLADAPADAPWLASVAQRIAALDAPPPNAAPGAPAALAGVPAEQLAMIRQMVAGLAGRLAKDGNDLAGWQKLVRAYAVLAQMDEARAALAAARGAFAADAPATAALDSLARDLGLGG